ncbi:MAG: Ku protein [Brachybacterium sp.]
MRAIWSGEITFGLVNVPVKLYGATRSHDISFHQVHDEDHGRIRYQRTCEVCGREIDYEHIDKAYDDGDKTVVLTDEELDALPAEDNDEIDVVQFVPNEQVDPILLGSSYFLEPVGRSSKAYVLLRRTLEETERTAVVTFTLRTKTRLGVLRIHGDLLALQTLRWPKDLKEVDFGPSKSKISAKELKMSASLVEQFSGDFEPEQFTDEYQAQLRELLDAKLEQGESVDTEATFGKESSEEDSAEGGKVISLMDALERSVRKRRGAQESEEPEESKGSDSKSSSTKSTSTKKTGTQKAKKTGTKKTEPKKTESGKSGAKKTASKKDGTKKTGGKSSGAKKSA